jgi:hypothetical protein
MAAGLGFKDFVTGEVLTAADVDGYLMQGIWVFDDAAARDAAVTSPQEGNACYLKDTNEVLTYSGSVWVAVGGGSPLTTKGDLYGFSTVDARIPIGANDTVLTADSTQSLGLKWATPSSGGMTLINSGGTTLTGASVTISSIPATYKNLQLVIINYLPATNYQYCKLRFNSDTGAHYSSGGVVTSNSFDRVVSWGANELTVSSSNSSSTANGISIVDVYSYATTGIYKLINWTSIGNDGTAPTADGDYSLAMGAYDQTGAITSITLFSSSGNFTSGTAYLYGVS